MWKPLTLEQSSVSSPCSALTSSGLRARWSSYAWRARVPGSKPIASGRRRPDSRWLSERTPEDVVPNRGGQEDCR
ncbi:hypothetical protein Zm00014a_043970 [Zea mays]|uniref:Uncharacterized protein n=1 Tax=Zea mays TaxID=4577 RepID=A0A3L6G9K2_MAIZE|nr:hypothetical protein Zm00014a_043970 [Zea mays]